MRMGEWLFHFPWANSFYKQSLDSSWREEEKKVSLEEEPDGRSRLENSPMALLKDMREGNPIHWAGDRVYSSRKFSRTNAP